MTRLVARLTSFAVALAAFAQVVVAPASCCLIRAELLGDDACCRSAASSETPSRSCCHGVETGPADALAGHRHPTPPSEECLWCSATPKVVSNDRAALPDLDAGPAFATTSLAEPTEAAPASRERFLAEPFHRTALAACAWLCVWLI